MSFHQGCKNHCGSILTQEEMNPEKNPSGRCSWCRERGLLTEELYKQYVEGKEITCSSDGS